MNLARRAKGDELVALTRTMLREGEIYKLDKRNPRDYEILKKMYATAKKSGDEKLLNDFEAKRIDMITDPSNYNLNKREMIEVAASNDPLLAQQIRQRKQQEAESFSLCFLP